MENMEQSWYEWACGEATSGKDANMDAITEAGSELYEYGQKFDLDENIIEDLVDEVIEGTYGHFPEDSEHLGGLTRAQASEKLKKDFHAAAKKLNIELKEKN